MKKVSEKTLRVYDWFAKGSLYLLAFLLPVFFLPWTSNILDFNKQALLIVLVFVSLFAWMIKVLVSGKLEFNLIGFHIPVGVFLLVYLVSTIFSLWTYGSFWGWPLSSAENLITIIVFCLLYLLVSNIFKKKEIFYLLSSLIVSGLVVMFIGILQIAGKFILPFDFSKATSFNMIGTVNALALFVAAILPLIIMLVINSKRILRILSVIVLLFAALLLILINFYVAWWVVIVGVALIMVLGLQKRNYFDTRWLILPMFFLAIALFFNFFKFQVPAPAPRPVEVSLGQNISFDIAWKSIKEDPIFGSGPGTFIYDYSRLKGEEMNSSPFWNVRFEGGASKILTNLATTGIVGVLSILSLIALFLFYGIKFLFRKKDKEEEEEGVSKEFSWMIGAGIFASFVGLSIGYFLYYSNITQDFLFFILIGSFIALLSPAKKEFELKPSSLLTLGITFAFTLVFIFGLGIIILEGQRYVAEVNYSKGVNAWTNGDIDESLNKIEKAISINSKSDLYWRDLSQVYLQKVTTEAQRDDLEENERNQRVQISINNAVNSAKTATDVNKNNVANWSVRGFIYQSLIGVVQGVENWAVESYTSAAKLEPTSPYYPAQSGISTLRYALTLSDDNPEKKELFIEAEESFKQAIELKSDYSPARYQLAAVLQAQGKINEAIVELEETKKLAPFDTGLAFQLGVIYYQIEDYDSAQKELERASGIDPNYANALYFLGLTYYKQGKKDQALEKLDKVLELNPNNEEVKKVIENVNAGSEDPLKGIIEETPPQLPFEEGSPDNLIEESLPIDETMEEF